MTLLESKVFMKNHKLRLILSMIVIILASECLVLKFNCEEFAMNVLERFALKVAMNKLFVAAFGLVMLLREAPPIT